MKENIILIACGILGVLFQSMVMLKGLLKDAQVANIDFNWKKDYVIKDAPSIILAFLSVAIWYFIFGEVTTKYTALVGFKRCSFVGMGALGSWIIQAALGTAKNRIRKIIDRKTDIADGKG